MKEGWDWFWEPSRLEATQATLCSGSPNCQLLLYPLSLYSKYKSLLFQSLVVKPDQLIKRRGKLGLVGVNLTLDGVKSWLKPRLGQEVTVSLGIGSGWVCCSNRSKHGCLQMSSHLAHPHNWSDCSLRKEGVLQGQSGSSFPALFIKE